MEAEAPAVEEDAAAPGAAEEGSRSNSKAGVPPLSMAKVEAAKRAAAAAAVMEKTFTDRQDLEAFLVFEGGANTIRWRHGCPPAALWKEAKLGDVADSARMTPRDPAKLDAVTRIIKATIVSDQGDAPESYLCLFYNETRAEVYVAATGFDTARLEKALAAYTVEKAERMRVETVRATAEQAQLEAADEEARALRAAEAAEAADGEEGKECDA